MIATRRDFLTASVAGLTGLALPIGWCRALAAAGIESTREFTVEQIDRVTVRLPYREIPERAMDREIPHWRYIQIFEVTLKSGHTGLGGNDAKSKRDPTRNRHFRGWACNKTRRDGSHSPQVQAQADPERYRKDADLAFQLGPLGK